MSRDTIAEHGAQPSKRVLLGSVVLSALFTYIVAVILMYPFQGMGEVSWGYPVIYLVGFPVAAVVLGIGLRRLARRYRTHTVQAGALIGAGIMTGLLITSAWYQYRWEFAGIATIGAVLPLPVVARITANPSPESGELTGAALLWQSLPGVSQPPMKDESSHSTRTDESTRDRIGHSTESQSSWGGLSVSRYWLVVGSAFAVAIPIALVDTELGIGLLSAFLTAYALSHRIEDESSNIDDEH